MARAMWKGTLAVGKLSVEVKFYSAVEDRTVRFRMLHRSDDAPVEQHIVRKDTGEEVERSDIRKAYAIDAHTALILTPEELQELTPADSREIGVTRFIPTASISKQWYDRPYLLGPDGTLEDYFALAQVLEREQLVGIAHWVMRRKRYVGALNAYDGYLMMSTLRRADQVLEFSDVKPASGVAPHANELKLGQQLVDSIAADFEPEQWKNEFRDRLSHLIEAKAHGKKLPAHRPRKRASQKTLAESLRASITAARERKVA